VAADPGDAAASTAYQPSKVDFPPDGLGPFAVGHTSFEAVDAARNDRTLPVHVWYPVDPGDEHDVPLTTYPLLSILIGLDSEIAHEDAPVTEEADRALVVFSHGSGGIPIQLTTVMENLASHGFVVAAPEHVGNSQASGDDDFDTAAKNRVPDVSFVIDTLYERGADTGDALYGRLGAQVGVMGHSFGGMTTLGMKTGWGGAQIDDRVMAIVPIAAVIDPNGRKEKRSGPNAGFTANELAKVDVPVLLVGGTKDADVFIENNAIAFEQLVGAPTVSRLDIIGATHTHFANVCQLGDRLLGLGIAKPLWPTLGAAQLVEAYDESCGPSAFPIEEAERLVSLFSVAFFRNHLQGESQYAGYLTEDFADTEASVNLWVR
jgi:predicted dienelactone hydrolase